MRPGGSRCLRSIEVEGLPARLGRLRPLLVRAAAKVLRAHGIGTYSISIAFVSDRKMAGLNRASLGRRGTTDVIAFDLSERGLPVDLVGDVYVSLDRARRQAADFGVGESEEILRLVLHGVLHTIGYEDGTESRRKKMNEAVEREIALLLRGRPRARSGVT